MKYRTKLIEAGVPLPHVHELDVEAPTARDAAIKADSIWRQQWEGGNLPKTQIAVHVYEIDPSTGDANSTCALIQFSGTTHSEPDVPDRKRAERASKKKSRKRLK